MATGGNILQEYLVKLGYASDTAGYARFAHALRDAESLVDNSYLAMAKRVLGFQMAATGAFAAIGSAAIGIADKTAMADQEYRLLALHMYTSLPVARELKIALDELGQPLENIMWDPELAKRFNQLVKDQRALTQELGPDFENQMLKIRDVRFEFNRFGVELQYLTMYVVEDLAKIFGTTVDGLLQKMRYFNDWFIANMPRIGDWIAQHLRPILVDVWQVLKETGVEVKQFATTFTDMIGVLSGDESLQGTVFSFEKLAGAIRTTFGWLKDFLISLMRTEEGLMHFVSAMQLLTKGDLSGAKREYIAGSDVLDLGTGIGRKYTVAPQGLPAFDIGIPGAMGLGRNRDATTGAIVALAQKMGVDPQLALAVADIESGFRQYDEQWNVLRSKVPGSHATGIYQLQPRTAAGLGVNPNDPMENIVGGISFLRQLLKQYGGNQELALEHYYGSKDAGANAAYAARVLQKAGDEYHITVNVPVRTNADPKEIGDSVWKALEGRLNNKTQRNLAELQHPGWSY
jgi:hypothetical protein